MVHNFPHRQRASDLSGVLVNFLGTICKLTMQAGLQKSDTIFVVHKAWNRRLVDDLDMSMIGIRYQENIGDLRGKLERIVGRVDDVLFEDLPDIKHVKMEEFSSLYGDERCIKVGDISRVYYHLRG
jgi:hypothetical protein